MNARRALAAAALASTLALAACADPYADEFGPAPDPGENAARARPHQESTRANAAAVARSFCREWANWTWQTMRRKRWRLAALAAGALKRSLRERPQIAGAEPPTALANRGAVVTVDVAERGRSRAIVCVTRERQFGAGEASAGRYVVYLGRLRPGARGWAMDEWRPQP